MSRLLTLLLLYRAGYIVGKYISIEKTIEQTKETYYEALESSSVNWHEGTNDYIPFVQYTLGVVVAAYREFSSRVKVLAASNMSKPERIREIIKDTLGKITKTDKYWSRKWQPPPVVLPGSPMDRGAWWSCL